jgi:hypothetical protein
MCISQESNSCSSIPVMHDGSMQARHSQTPLTACTATKPYGRKFSNAFWWMEFPFAKLPV